MERFHTHLDTCIWSIIWKWLNWLFWASFEKPDFLTIFEVSYDPKQWRYQVFSGKIVFSAVQNPHTWILSPTPREYYGFQGVSKVRFSAFKVVAQENFHWCFVKENFGDFLKKIQFCQFIAIYWVELLRYTLFKE